MATKKQIQNKVKAIGAKISPYSTNEVWIDDDGNTYFIDRAPIDWERVVKGVVHETNQKQ